MVNTPLKDFLTNGLLTITGLAVSIFLFLPLFVYATNLDDVDTHKSVILGTGLVFSIALGGSIAALLYLLNKHEYFLRFLQIVLVTHFILILIPNHTGEITGFAADPQFTTVWYSGVKVAILAALGLFMAIRYPEQLRGTANTFSVLVVAGSLYFAVFTTSALDGQKFSDEEKMLGYVDLGTQSNIIVLVLDGFTGYRLVEIFAEYPDLEKVFDGFTVYPRAIAPALNTPAGNSVILTGGLDIALHNSTEILRNSRSLEDSFLAKATRYGYKSSQISPLPVVDNLIPTISERTFFTSLPTTASEDINSYLGFLAMSALRVLPGPVARIFVDLVTAGNTANGKAGESDREILKRLVIPTEIAPLSGKIAFDNFIDKIHVGLAKKRAIYLFSQISHSRPNFTIEGKFQLGAGWESTSTFVVKEVFRFNEKLKHLKSYDNSLLIIASDHGAMPVQDPGRGGLFTDDLPLRNAFNPLLMVKPINSRGKVRISDMTVWLGDIYATVSEAIGAGLNTDPEIPVRALTGPDDPDREISVPIFFRPPGLSYHSSLEDWARADGKGIFEAYAMLTSARPIESLSRPGTISLYAGVNAYNTMLAKQKWRVGKVAPQSVWIQFNRRTIRNLDNGGIVALLALGDNFSARMITDPVEGLNYISQMKGHGDLFAAGLNIPVELIGKYFPDSVTGFSGGQNLNFVLVSSRKGVPGDVFKLGESDIEVAVDWPGLQPSRH